jgi:hypothetical protein
MCRRRHAGVRYVILSGAPSVGVSTDNRKTRNALRDAGFPLADAFPPSWTGTSGPRSAVEGRQIKSAETLGVGQYVDLHDLASGNREAEDGEWPPVHAARYEPDVAVHENNLIGQAKSRERSRLYGDGLCTTHDP